MAQPLDKERTLYMLKRTNRLPALDRLPDAVRAALPVRLRFMLPDRKTVLEVPADDHLIVGRRTAEESPVQVDLSGHVHALHGVSRYHCAITTIHGNVMIQDLDSTNGTVLNDRMLNPLQRYVLRSGDLITLGKFTMQVMFVHKEDSLGDTSEISGDTEETTSNNSSSNLTAGV